MVRGTITMIKVPLTYDQIYEFVKLYDIIRDMDFELTENQRLVFETIEHYSVYNQEDSNG